MSRVIFIISKDALQIENLPTYGNTYWNTPNIDALAEKGTVFQKHYSVAASTAMSFSGFLTGKYPYEFERADYSPVKNKEYESIFDILQKKEYQCHVIWDKRFMFMLWPFTREFGDENKTIVHNLTIAQPAGYHNIDGKILQRNDLLCEENYRQIEGVLEQIDFSKDTFVLLHLPHVLLGRTSYGDDIDVMDNIVGIVRKWVPDESIYITADHGHMNWNKNKVGYGFDLYEPIVRIPLITPRIADSVSVQHITSNVDLTRIILDNEIIKREFVYSDTAYYKQPQRKVCVISDRFKYIYNKQSRNEEFYDLKWDPKENHNILVDELYYEDRDKVFKTTELYFYPYKEMAYVELDRFRKEVKNIWREETGLEGFYLHTRAFMGRIRRKIKKIAFEIKSSEKVRF